MCQGISDFVEAVKADDRHSCFARMNGNENDSCMQLLRDMNVVEVPTFLFFRDGEDTLVLVKESVEDTSVLVKVSSSERS